MAYINGIFYVDQDNGNDAARTTLTGVTVSNPSGSITRANKTAHGLGTGDIVDATSFSAWIIGAWRVTVVDADNFDLDGAVWQATADASGNMTPRGGCRFADAWKTLQGATSARVEPGDVVRMKASPQPTLIGNADWTKGSKTITLAAAVTANIADCETVWTGSANVTQTADTAQFRQGTKSAKSVIATGFTTGIVAYFATGALDLSAYQQVSFWIYHTAALVDGTLSLRLCSDAVGAVPVHTLAIPANPRGSEWTWFTLDNGSALSSGINSISLYANLDPGVQTVQLDNIIACKADSAADALHLGSYIGKVHNLSWEANTAYPLNAKRRPTQPNRNGFQYKVTTAGTTHATTEPTWPLDIGLTVNDGTVVWTCVELEDTWYPVQSINGITVMIDPVNAVVGSVGRGYGRTTEAGVATYRREASHVTPLVSTIGITHSITDGGTPDAPITYSGGWDRTAMAVQDGETWVDMANSRTHPFSSNVAYAIITNLNAGRGNIGLSFTGNFTVVTNCHSSGSSIPGSLGGINARITGFQAHGGATGGSTVVIVGRGCVVSRAVIQGQASVSGDGVSVNTAVTLSLVEAVNNEGYGVIFADDRAILRRVHAELNAIGSVNHQQTAGGFLHRCTLDDATQFIAYTAFSDEYVRSQDHGDVAGAHLLITDGGTISSATDQRHTASGISWKFNPTSVNRARLYPLRLSVAKIACAANVAVTVKVYVRRDSANIKGQLLLRGGQIAGVVDDLSVSCVPTVNAWEQSSALTFTPTVAGVVEILFECWDGVNTTNSMWIDDLEVT